MTSFAWFHIRPLCCHNISINIWSHSGDNENGKILQLVKIKTKKTAVSHSDSFCAGAWARDHLTHA